LNVNVDRSLAGLVGHAEIYVSGGAEHQGPSGGGPVAVIVRRLPVELAPSSEAGKAIHEFTRITG